MVTPADNMLPPDNFQEQPRPVIAHRTSPTNIGLYLLSTIAARGFGWSGTAATVERLEAAFTAMRKLPRSHGRFYNWYRNAGSARADACLCLIGGQRQPGRPPDALANACEEWIRWRGGAGVPAWHDGHRQTGARGHSRTGHCRQRARRQTQ
ncbi:hypothetical protein ACU4GD_37725 [Cupriavidus basilensis]